MTNFSTYSDMYKEIFGVRPRTIPSESAIEKFMNEYDSMFNAKMDEVKAREEKAEKEFDALIEKTIKYGAGDRATAIRWIVQEDNCFDTELFDVSFFLFKKGIESEQSKFVKEISDALEGVVEKIVTY